MNGRNGYVRSNSGGVYKGVEARQGSRIEYEPKYVRGEGTLFFMKFVGFIALLALGIMQLF